MSGGLCPVTELSSQSLGYGTDKTERFGFLVFILNVVGLICQ